MKASAERWAADEASRGTRRKPDEPQPRCLLQVFKFIYSCRLAEMGLAAQALQYCEVIARTILLQPHWYSLVLVSQLAQVCPSIVPRPSWPQPCRLQGLGRLRVPRGLRTGGA